MIRVLIVDDHLMFAEGIALMLQDLPEVEVVGIAKSGMEALDKLENTAIDLILLDLNMPELSGEDTVEIMRKRFDNIKVLVLSMRGEPSFIKRMLELKVDGYMLKNTNREELQKAIETVSEGGSYFSKGLLSAATDIITGKKTDHEVEDQLALLSWRELEIIKYTAMNYSMTDVAATLKISVNTVKTHRKNIYNKLGINSLIGVVKFALENGLLENTEK
ncbi:response regulator [bacterium]|nr:response regulator [bacterium]